MDQTRTGRREPFVGRPMPRLQDFRLITGRGRYTDDISYPDETHAAFVRSPHPHARVLGIDTGAAKAMAGVLAVYTADDYAAAGGRGLRHFAVPADAHDVKKPSFHDWSGPAVFEMAQPVLAADRVRHVGEPVAMVVAETAALAHEAAAANVAMDKELGDPAALKAAFAAAHLVVEHTFRAQRIVNAQMEPRASIGLFDAQSGMLTALACSQGVSRLKTNVADCLAL